MNPGVETPIDAESLADFVRSLDGNFRVDDVSETSVKVSFGTVGYSGLPTKVRAAGWVVDGVSFSSREITFRRRDRDSSAEKTSEAYFRDWLQGQDEGGSS